MIRPELPQLALSIRQPWIWAMINLGKDIENRSWLTRYRGPVCLHASLGMKSDDFWSALDDFNSILNETDVSFAPKMLARRNAAWDNWEQTRGHICATAEIVDCVTTSESPWFFGPYGFVLSNIKPLDEPINVRGTLGFFDWRKNVQVAA